jgi:hypothetical protein
MAGWIKRLVHHLAVTLYGALEIWDIPKMPKPKRNGKERS